MVGGNSGIFDEVKDTDKHSFVAVRVIVGCIGVLNEGK